MIPRIRRSLLAAIALVFPLATALSAQTPTVSRDLGARVLGTRLLPSRIPVQFIRIDVAPLADFSDPATKAAAVRAVSDPSNWVLGITRDGRTRRVAAPGSSVLMSRDSSIAQLILRAGLLDRGDTVEVGVLKNDTLFMNATGATRLVAAESGPDPFTLRTDPKQVPDQKLLGGGSADVIQFGLNFEAPSLLGNAGGARVYLKGNNLLSTDERDVATRVQATGGLEFSPLRAWHVPVFAEATYQANQRFSNTSGIASLGFRTIVPWAWTRSLLWNGVLRAPVSPELSFLTELQRRFEVDTLVARSSAKDNLVRLTGRVDWAPIFLLPGREADHKDIVLEPSLRGWFFPSSDARGGTNIREFEGRADLSLYVPVSGFPMASFLAGGGEETLTRLKVQFVSGANDANGFARSVEWKIGFEVAK